MVVGKCLIQIQDSDEIAFVGEEGLRVSTPQDAKLFDNELAAQLYIEAYRLDRIGRIRKIVTVLNR